MAPYIEALFKSLTCDVNPSINTVRDCYIYCNSGVESCVAFYYTGDNQCFFCDKNTNTHEIPPQLRPRYHVWKSHLLSLDPCAITPCEHGTCTKVTGSFRCDCDENYGGRLCDSFIGVCQAACDHGSCLEDANGFACSCEAGAKGVDCDMNIDECLSSPCIGGICMDGMNGYTCTCRKGFTGVNCETDIDDCLSGPCVNGECTDDVNTYTCDCSVGFTGVNCESNIDECPSSPCVNGECADDVNTYTCDCYVGFTGVNCETEMECNNRLLYNLPDSAFSASSISSSYSHLTPYNSRLHQEGWGAGQSRNGEWIEVDLGQNCLVNSIITRGNVRGSFVRKFNLGISSDGQDSGADPENIEPGGATV